MTAALTRLPIVAPCPAPGLEPGLDAIPCEVLVCDPTAPERPGVERFIAEIFSAAYQATVMEYMPLLVYRREGTKLQSALGLRSAAGSPLFCEQYLDTPLESCVAREFGRSVPRGRLMELGNLVSATPGQSAALYLLVLPALHMAGISHLVFAANRAVRLSIRRCGFQSRDLGPARPEALGSAASRWGSYYTGDPRVILADIGQAVAFGRSVPALRRLWQSELPRIEVLSDAIRGLRG